MPDPRDDLPFPHMARLIIAAQEGDYARAARAQERLRELGWYVSRIPPEQAKKPRSNPPAPKGGGDA
jgi:hypothetical protein